MYRGNITFDVSHNVSTTSRLAANDSCSRPLSDHIAEQNPKQRPACEHIGNRRIHIVSSKLGATLSGGFVLIDIQYLSINLCQLPRHNS